ncbi:MAG: alpha/beta fold hydrolase [Actinomycetaceae bacterium]|nr:alpha/beta fold hydrolase [Actinomycetaceae bacterium]
MEIHSRLASTTSPRGTVLVTHGYGEHSGHYAPLFEALHAADFDVIYGDLPGHGTAPGPRGIVDVGALISLHIRTRRLALTRARTADLFCLGHSMGGLITAASALIDPHNLKGIILCAPALQPLPQVDPEVARRLVAVGRFIPWAPAAFLSPSLVSCDPAVVQKILDDPLFITDRPVSVLTGGTMTVQAAETRKRAGTLAVPAVIFHGTHDKLADLSASRQFVASAVAARPQADVTLNVVDGGWHQLLDERPEIIGQMIQWLDARS